MPSLSLDALRLLLGLPQDAPEIWAIARPQDVEIDFSSGEIGFVEIRPLGISFVFKPEAALEPPRRVPVPEKPVPEKMVLKAIHFFSEGYEDYRRYCGRLPGGIRFGDEEHAVVAKLGGPHEKGGGNYVAALRKVNPTWLKYRVATEIVHLQLGGASAGIDLVTMWRDAAAR